MGLFKYFFDMTFIEYVAEFIGNIVDFVRDIFDCGEQLLLGYGGYTDKKEK